MTKKVSPLTEALLETAKEMRDADLLDAATYEKITLRHRRPQAPASDAMSGDEIGPGEAIAVEKYDVHTARCADRAIADFAGAKSAMLMPDMGEMTVSDFRFPAPAQRRCRR